MAFLSNDDIIQVTFRNTLFGQRILTVLHYYVFTTSGAENVLAACDRIANYLNNNANEPLTSYQLAVCAGMAFDEVRVQRVYPTRDPYSSAAVALVGTQGGTAFNANTAASIQKKTAVTGRYAIGRMQMAGGPLEELSGAEWSAPYRAAELSNLGQALTAALTLTGPLLTLKPCLYNPTQPNPKYNEVIAYAVEREQRTMHRRTLRLGE